MNNMIVSIGEFTGPFVCDNCSSTSMNSSTLYSSKKICTTCKSAAIHQLQKESNHHAPFPEYKCNICLVNGLPLYHMGPPCEFLYCKDCEQLAVSNLFKSKN